MNIAVLTSLYPSPPRPREGIFAERRWRGMRERGHSVRVIHPQPRTPGPLAIGSWDEIRRMPAEESRAGIEVQRPRYLHLPRRARRNAKRFARVGVRELLARARPDIAVLDYAWPAAEAAPLLEAQRIPCVVHGRGSDVLQVAGEAGLGDELARCLVAAGHWCAVSLDLVRAMDGLAGAPGRGRLTPNGVDLERFHPGGRREARERLPLEGDAPLVLVVGHLIERKDPLLALEAFARGAPSGARLVFVGRGPLADEVVARARGLGVSARVLLRGEAPPDELAEWYRAADLLLLTSRREGRPNVVLEALASGLPVLATEAGGTGELLEPFASRLLVRGRDPEELARRLGSLLEAPPPPEELRASVAHLSWDACLAELERVLAEALGGGGERR
ncbi:MAG TPA: glycosyltransferase family 4 protein [Planctomycetes bacterium]|nr:glycosyltransferase family 4 protein [Planctomycetota bacterium]